MKENALVEPISAVTEVTIRCEARSRLLKQLGHFTHNPLPPLMDLNGPKSSYKAVKSRTNIGRLLVTNTGPAVASALPSDPRKHWHLPTPSQTLERCSVLTGRRITRPTIISATCWDRRRTSGGHSMTCSNGSGLPSCKPVWMDTHCCGNGCRHA